jgi:DNA-binding XRE family transcriptional regulator
MHQHKDEMILINKHQKQRASKNALPLDNQVRKAFKNKVVEQLQEGKLTQGEALKILRVQVLNVRQEQFAKLVKVSRKTVSDIENDNGNYSVDLLNQVFRPFGLQLGLVEIKR